MKPARAAVALCLVTAFAIGASSCSTSTSPTSPSPTTPTPKVTYASIEYKVTGTATSSASLTYALSAGSTSQLSRAALPWSFKFVGESGQFLYVSAQNNDDVGCIRAEILKDGEVFKTAFSCGAYVIATASGSF